VTFRRVLALSSECTRARAAGGERGPWNGGVPANVTFRRVLVVLCQEQEYCRDIFVVTKEVCDG
jgi:hypothetical protein